MTATKTTKKKPARKASPLTPEQRRAAAKKGVITRRRNAEKKKVEKFIKYDAELMSMAMSLPITMLDQRIQDVTREISLRLFNEALDKNIQLVMFATYNCIFVADIADGAVTQLQSAIEKAGLYRHEVKQNYRRMVMQTRHEFHKRYNVGISASTEGVVDANDAFYERIHGDLELLYNVLRQQTEAMNFGKYASLFARVEYALILLSVSVKSLEKWRERLAAADRLLVEHSDLKYISQEDVLKGVNDFAHYLYKKLGMPAVEVNDSIGNAVRHITRVLSDSKNTFESAQKDTLSVSYTDDGEEEIKVDYVRNEDRLSHEEMLKYRPLLDVEYEKLAREMFLLYRRLTRGYPDANNMRKHGYVRLADDIQSMVDYEAGLHSARRNEEIRQRVVSQHLNSLAFATKATANRAAVGLVDCSDVKFSLENTSSRSLVTVISK